MGDKETGDRAVLGICQRCRRWIAVGATCLACSGVLPFASDSPHTHEESAPPPQNERVLMEQNSTVAPPAGGFWVQMSSGPSIWVPRA
jgi:hypothetical protein